MTDLQFLEKDDKNSRSVFLLKNCNASFANALRRTMIDSVPAMAIQEVEFRKNSSVLYDEVIAHRLGLLPLKTDLKSYFIKDECKCGGEGCPRCSIAFTLKARGPGIVYASELKSKDPKIKPVFPKMPIVKLLKGQEIELEATATVGRGAEHTKFSPCLAWYKKKPAIDIDDKKCTNADIVAKSCPKNVFDVKAGRLVAKRVFDCHLCKACADIASNKSVRLNESENEFVFYIESWGQLGAREIASNAIELLHEKVTKLGEVLSE